MAGLEVDVPDVVKVTAEGIVIQFDPGLTGAAGRSQELVRINSAKVLFPKFGVQGEIRPFDPSTGHNVTLGPNDASTGLIPGLVVRRNGFTIGTAELSIGREDTSGGALTTASSQKKITFGDILEFDDLRIGVNNFEVNFDATNPVVFNGSIFVASGGAKFFPGRPFSAELKDRDTADDVNPDGTPNDEAVRLQLTFSQGKVSSFQFQVDTMVIHLSSFVTLTATDLRLDTGAAANQELISFQSVGAVVMWASAALHTPSPLLSRRWLVSGRSGSSGAWQTCVLAFGLMPNGSSMSARFLSPSPLASVSTTAASAKARTTKMSLPSSPSSRSSAWFE